MRTTMSLFFMALLLLPGLGALPARADGIADKLVNDPARGWSVFGKLADGKMIEDKTVQGGTAVRVTVTAAGEHPWDAGGMTNTAKPVAAGDVLLLAFYAKAITPPEGRKTVQIIARIQETDAPYTTIGTSETLELTDQWKMYYVRATAGKDYRKSKLGAGLNFATGVQVFDLGPIMLLDFGADYDQTKLPKNR